MNASLQSLIYSYPLSVYFLSNYYKQELNVDNPLGHKGNVANVYAKLVKSLWSTKSKLNSSLAPREIKSVIGKIAPRFIGRNQQDAQEFLNFLLDGLHEDLNRILKKPYYSEPLDSDGLANDDLWQRKLNQRKLCHAFLKRYLSRNKSIIIDLFTGVLKSTLSFSCGYKSITFDPFLTLSLPIPEDHINTMINNTHLQFDILLFFHDGRRKPSKFYLDMDINEYNIDDINELSIIHLKEKLEEISGIYTSCLQMADINNNVIWRFLPNNMSLKKIFTSCISNSLQNTASLYAYEIPPPSLTDQQRKKRQEIIQKRIKQRQLQSISHHQINQHDDEHNDDQIKKKNFEPNQLQIGDLVDILDTANKWILCEIIDIKEANIKQQEEDDDDDERKQVTTTTTDDEQQVNQLQQEQQVNQAHHHEQEKEGEDDPEQHKEEGEDDPEQHKEEEIEEEMEEDNDDDSSSLEKLKLTKTASEEEIKAAEAKLAREQLKNKEKKNVKSYKNNIIKKL